MGRHDTSTIVAYEYVYLSVRALNAEQHMTMAWFGRRQSACYMWAVTAAATAVLISLSVTGKVEYMAIVTVTNFEMCDSAKAVHCTGLAAVTLGNIRSSWICHTGLYLQVHSGIPSGVAE